MVCWAAYSLGEISLDNYGGDSYNKMVPVNNECMKRRQEAVYGNSYFFRTSEMLCRSFFPIGF